MSCEIIQTFPTFSFFICCCRSEIQIRPGEILCQMRILLHPDMEKGEVHHTCMLAELQHKDKLLTPEYNIHARIMQRSPIPLCSSSARNSLPLPLAPGLCHDTLKEREQAQE